MKNLAKIFSFKTDLAHTLFPFLSQRRHSDVENVLFNISSLSKFYLNYEPSLKGPDVDKEQIFYFLRWKVQRKVCFIKPIETIVTRPKGPRDTTDLLDLPVIPHTILIVDNMVFYPTIG